MKRYKNVSSRHLQFTLAKIELAPGQEVELADIAAKNDPGFDSCLARGLIEDLAAPKRKRTVSKAPEKSLTASDQKGKSKSDLFEAKDGDQPEIPPADDKKDE